MKKKKLLIIVLIIVLLLIGLLTTIFFIQIPCGGIIEEGGVFRGMWDGTCAYGPILIKNIQNGHFFFPFGYK